MRIQTTTFLLLLLAAISFGSARAVEPGIDITATVTRYSEFELTEHQATILDEATKVSAASRVFYGLYSRWPKDIKELSERTSGVNFTVFNGKISIDHVPEGLVISVFDSKDVRQLLATASSSMPDELRKLAEDPNFKIRVSLHREQLGGP